MLSFYAVLRCNCFYRCSLLPSWQLVELLLKIVKDVFLFIQQRLTRYIFIIDIINCLLYCMVCILYYSSFLRLTCLFGYFFFYFTVHKMHPCFSYIFVVEITVVIVTLFFFFVTKKKTREN